MNPFRWRREHQVAWLVTCVLGALVGLCFGFILSLAQSGGSVAGPWLAVWIQVPQLYWPWPVFGAAIAGLASYAARLWISN
jgi:hypothetical protein